MLVFRTKANKKKSHKYVNVTDTDQCVGLKYRVTQRKGEIFLLIVRNLKNVKNTRISIEISNFMNLMKKYKKRIERVLFADL